MKSDNENIKALENLHNRILNDASFLAKVNHGELSALFHIKRILECQDAEIERLQKVIETMTNEQLQFGFETKSEIEKLEYAIDAQATENADLYREIKIAKAEAIKEFADRLKKRTHKEEYSVFDCVDSVYDEDIDIVLKEMVGDVE
jgi:archaellum component FlaC